MCATITNTHYAGVRSQYSGSRSSGLNRGADRSEPLEPRVVDEHLRRAEPPREPTMQVVEISTTRGLKGIDVAERAAPERREANAEHRADVTVARRAQNPILQTTRGLVHHREHAATLDLRVALRRVRPPGRSRTPTGLPRPFSRPRRTCRSPSSFRPSPGRDDARSDCDGAIRSPNASSMIAPDFPATSSPTSSSSVIGPTGKPNSTSAPSMASIAAPSSSRRTGFVYVGREDPVGVEAGRVVHDDHRLATACRRRRRSSMTSRLVSAASTMTSSSGILCTGEKKCIPSTRSGRDDASAIRAIGIVLVFDAKIACSAGLPLPLRADDLMLDGEILEHRLDHEIDVAEARVVDRAADERSM